MRPDEAFAERQNVGRGPRCQLTLTDVEGHLREGLFIAAEGRTAERKRQREGYAPQTPRGTLSRAASEGTPRRESLGLWRAYKGKGGRPRAGALAQVVPRKQRELVGLRREGRGMKTGPSASGWVCAMSVCM